MRNRFSSASISAATTIVPHGSSSPPPRPVPDAVPARPWAAELSGGDVLHRCPHGPQAVSFEYAFFENAFFENFANFWRARSRLYQNEILQENMRSTAFFKLYKVCILLHRCNLNILAKNRFEKSAIFVKIQQKKLQMLQML